MSFKSIDIFGSPVNMHIKNERVVKTREGAYFTIIVVIICIVSTWLIGKDIIYKQQPYSYFQSLPLPNYPELNWNSSILPISFGIQDNNGVNLDFENKLELVLYQYHYTSDENGDIKPPVKTQLPVAKCNHSHFPHLDEKTFDSIRLQYTYCPDNINMTVKGFWSESEIYLVRLDVKICTGKANCKNMAEIAEFIKSNTANLQLYFLDSLININNFTNPINNKIASPFVYLYSTTLKIVTFNIQQNSIQTDDAFFSESLTTLNYLTIGNLLIDSTDYNDKSGSILTLEIYSSNVSDNIYRKYIKVTDIAAGVGGLFKLLTVISLVYSEFYTELEKIKIIVEEMFKKSVDRKVLLKDYENKLKLFPNLYNKNQMLISLKNDNLEFPKDIPPPRQDNIIYTKSEASESEKNEFFNNTIKNLGACIKLKIVVLYKMFLCKKWKGKTVDKFEQIESVIYSYIDVVYMIEKFIDLEKQKKSIVKIKNLLYKKAKRSVVFE